MSDDRYQERKVAISRELRRVPPDWEHPKYTLETTRWSDRIGKFIPLFDDDFESAAEEWIAGLIAWQTGVYIGKFSTPEPHDFQDRYYWEYCGNPPTRESHRDRRWKAEEATAYQIYETVSEGTPISPVLVSEEAVVEYLVEHGDGWDRPVSRDAAERFVRAGTCMSMAYLPDGTELLGGETA